MKQKKSNYFIKTFAEKLKRATEHEMRSTAPKCPIVYYQPARPVKKEHVDTKDR